MSHCWLKRPVRNKHCCDEFIILRVSCLVQFSYNWVFLGNEADTFKIGAFIPHNDECHYAEGHMFSAMMSVMMPRVVSLVESCSGLHLGGLLAYNTRIIVAGSYK